LIAASYLVRTLRVYRYFDLHRGFGAMLRLLLQHNACVVLLPMRTGELAFPLLMRRFFQTPVQQSVPALLWLRLIDLHTLVLMLLLVASALWWRSAPAIAATLAWAGAPLVFMLLARKVRRPQLNPGEGSRITRIVNSLADAVPSSVPRIVEDWVLTVANWTLKLLAFGWIVQLFSDQTYQASVIGAAGGELSVVVPINGVAGFGTYEAGVAVAMQSVGVTLSNALAGAVNLHFVSLGTAIVLALAAQFIRLPAAVQQAPVLADAASKRAPRPRAGRRDAAPGERGSPATAPRLAIRSR
jgi:glycosyltransferase 2 family protein